MLNTVRAVVKEGQIRLLEKLELPEGTELLVTPLVDDSDSAFCVEAIRVFIR